MSPLMTEVNRKLMILQFNQTVKGMMKVTVTRKQKKSATGIQPGFDIIEVYKELDCDFQNIRPPVRTKFGKLATGVADFVERICFMPRYLIEKEKITAIVVIVDDQLIIEGGNFKAVRVDPYEDHLEVVCEPTQA